MAKHKLEVETDVLDAISRAVSKDRDATVARIRRITAEGTSTAKAEESLRLLTEASEALNRAQLDAV